MMGYFSITNVFVGVHESVDMTTTITDEAQSDC